MKLISYLQDKFSSSKCHPVLTFRVITQIRTSEQQASNICQIVIGAKAIAPFKVASNVTRMVARRSGYQL